MPVNARAITWITGASSGIGEALAVACAKQGHRLVLSARRRAELARVQARCCEHGLAEADVLVLPLDVTEHDAMPGAVDQVVAHFGRIDLLINNAGVSQRSLFTETDLRVFREILEVDVLGPIALTKAVLPVMLEQRSGHVAVTSSIAGKIGVPYRTGYCSAKHAIMGFFDSLRAELDGTGLEVSTILPGFVRTNLSKAALTGDGSPFGKTDRNIRNGMDADSCARVILSGLKRGKREIVVAQGAEKHTVWLKRFFPGLVMRVAPRFGKPEV